MTGTVSPMMVAIYPREGTETARCGLRLGAWNDVAIYPREGTETFWKSKPPAENFALQFIPARGRKPAPPPASHARDNHRVAIYPREGTET